ncbi:MAG: head maturation protease, ClpP-related [Planctomycetota bacterium]
MAPKIENKAADEATIYLYDEISFWGINAGDFVQGLAAIDASTIHLRVNSPGGNVYDGTAIYQALNEHPAHIVAHIDGLCASIAAEIVMACDEIRMAESGRFMIHDTWSIVIGGAEDMRREADFLVGMNETCAATYVARTGADADQVREWMAAETWFTAQEAKDAGFVDAIEPLKTAPKALKVFDLSAFANTPAELKDREPPTERDLEKVLRDAGLSRTEAKSILAEGLKAAPRDAAPPEPQAPVPPRDVATPAPEAPAAPPIKVDPVLALLGKAEKCLATNHLTTTEGVPA